MTTRRGRSAVRSIPGGPGRRAVADVAPVVLGVLPLGMVVGMAVRTAAVHPLPGLGTALLIFSGAGNLTALSVAGAGGGTLAMVGAVAIVNARLALYGALLEPRFRSQPLWFRVLGPHTIVDQTYGLAAARPELGDGARFRRWWLTVGAVLAAGWCSAVALGLALGPVLPAGSPLAIAGPACLVALLVPRLRELPGLAAAVVAAGVAVACARLPGSTGLVAGAVAGLLAAAVTQRVRR
ncbi:AzlC family ABC transporter permease [Pseudonocardia sp.]|uniref:AzlC family ABC transporter permease n=1 Tax=Pseudonocardia sp. TaxID=60912 RepID=UPI003D130C68